MDDNLKVLIGAILDTANSKSTLDAQIALLSSKLKPLNINAQIGNLKEIQSQLKDIKFNIEIGLSGKDAATKNIHQMTNDVKKSMDIQKNIFLQYQRSIMIENAKMMNQQYQSLEHQSKKILDDRRRILSDAMKSSPINNDNNRILNSQYRLLNTQYRLANKEMMDEFKIHSSSLKTLDNMASDASKNINRLTSGTQVYNRELDQLKNKIDSIRNFKHGENKGQSIHNINNDLKNLNDRINVSIEDQIKRQNNRYQDILRSRLDVFKHANPKALSSETISSYYNQISQTLNQPNLNASKLREITKEISLLTAQTHQLGLTGNTMFGSIAEKANKFATWFSISQVVMKGVHSLKLMYQEVQNIDTAITNLKKVTNETDGSYANFMNNAITMAKDLRAQISDIIESTADWARLGYSIQKAQENAKASIILKQVGEMDIESSTQAIISTLKSYGSQVGSTMEIIDKYNEVGNNFAISSKGVAEAMQRSASALKLGGNSLDEAIAIITAGNTVIQDPAAVGTFAKTMSMRLRGSSNIPKNLRDELEEMGEDLDDIDETVTQVQAKMLKFTQGRVNIMLDENTFKSTYQILKEINAIWDDLTDKNRADIVELVGGNIYYSFNNIALSVQKCA